MGNLAQGAKGEAIIGHMVSLSEALTTIETGRQRTGRSCGSCSECCRLIGVEELAKPAGQWCAHCDPGHGCRIYPDRPKTCQGFSCLWLVNPEFGEHWRPTVAHMVIQVAGNPDRVEFVVDANCPEVWRQSPHFEDILGVARHGLGAGRYATYVVIGSRVMRVEPSLARTERDGGG